MTLTCKDRYLIESLYKEKGWGATKIMRFFPNMRFKLSTVNYWIRRIKASGSTARKKGSGRKRSIRTEGIINRVAQLIVTTPTSPQQSHKSLREIARSEGLSKSSVHEIVKKDLKLHAYRKVRGQKLIDRIKRERVSRCQGLLGKFRQRDIGAVWFTDEKMFTVRTPKNSQNDRVYSPQKPKQNVPSNRLVSESSHFTEKVMVSVGVSKRGKTNAHFIPANTKVNVNYYKQTLLNKKLLPDIDRIMHGTRYTFQQDGASSHTAIATVQYLERRVPDFIKPTEWPPNSPDLNPVDYHVWGALQELVYRKPISDLHQLQQRIRLCWRSLSQRGISRAIDQFIPRLRKVVEVGGAHIEQFF